MGVPKEDTRSLDYSSYEYVRGNTSPWFRAPSLGYSERDTWVPRMVAEV